MIHLLQQEDDTFLFIPFCWHIIQIDREKQKQVQSVSLSARSCWNTMYPVLRPNQNDKLSLGPRWTWNESCRKNADEKKKKKFWKKLSNTNNDMLYYNFLAAYTVLASTAEFLQTQTCYCNSSSNYNFRHTFQIDRRPQTVACNTAVHTTQTRSSV